MIVRILSSSRTFKGVKYNTDKVDANKGELIKVVNFGPLQALGHQKPQDYVNYLKMISSQNKNIKSPQFHVAISTKSRNHSKEDLTLIAEKWLAKMGYQKQPYLIVFHKDTRNNHVHIVSTRIDRDGQKISSAFEKNRAIQSLNQVMGLNEELQAAKHFEEALRYKFSSKAQFMLILESKNYTIGGTADRMDLIKFGKVVGQFDTAAMNQTIAESKIKEIPGQISIKDKRARQLTAIFNKYLEVYSSSLYHQVGSLAGGRGQLLSTYSSDFAYAIKQKFGIDIIFHSNDDKLPYGYSVIDHTAEYKIVYKGGEIMDLGELLKDHGIQSMGISSRTDPTDQPKRGDISGHDLQENRFENFVGESIGQTMHTTAEKFTGVENYNEISNTGSYAQSDFPSFADYSPSAPGISIDIADDIDDEGILGRNRKRQKKARTNTR